MKAAVNKADTAQELEELRKIWAQLGQVGKLSSQEQARGLGFLNEKIKDTRRKAAEIGDLGGVSPFRIYVSKFSGAFCSSAPYS